MQNPAFSCNFGQKVYSLKAGNNSGFPAKLAAKLGPIDSWRPGSHGPGLKLRLLFKISDRLLITV